MTARAIPSPCLEASLDHLSPAEAVEGRLAVDTKRLDHRLLFHWTRSASVDRSLSDPVDTIEQNTMLLCNFDPLPVPDSEHPCPCICIQPMKLAIHCAIGRARYTIHHPRPYRLRGLRRLIGSFIRSKHNSISCLFWHLLMPGRISVDPDHASQPCKS